MEKMLKAEASADGIPAKTITNKRLAAIQDFKSCCCEPLYFCNYAAEYRVVCPVVEAFDWELTSHSIFRITPRPLRRPRR